MRRGLVAALVLGIASTAGAAPDLNEPRQLGDLVVYPDHEKAHLFYFGPGALELATDAEGRPGLRFLQLRYVGSALYGSEGEAGVDSALTLRLRMQAPPPADVQKARHVLRKVAGDVAVELRPLPIAALDARIVYASLAGDAPGEPQRLPAGYFEADASKGAASSRRAYWRERGHTLSLDPATSQLLWKMLHEGQVLMSVSYAFFAKGVEAGADVQVAASGADPVALEEMLASLRDADPASADAEGAVPLRTQLVRAGATAVRIDAARWPELFERVDFDEEAPPGYAALRVYCYDFHDRLRPDLFYKKVEIEAEAVGGRRVPIAAKFLGGQPELYATTVRFPVAVHVDRPFRYRVLAARRDGSIETGPWQERSDWGGILDVTSNSP
ncbi:MAG: hypothetical protein ABFS41_01560 [Myxococcota bacterium]